MLNINEQFTNDNIMIGEAKYCEKIEDLKNPIFTKPENIVTRQADICVGFVLINDKKSEELEESFKAGVMKMIDSVFKHTEQSLHLVILTDKRSLKVVGEFLAKVVTKMLGTHAILSRCVLI